MNLSATDTLLLSALLPVAPCQQRLHALLLTHAHAIDWEKFVQRSLALGIAPLVRFNLSQAKALEFLPTSATEKLAHASQASAAKHFLFVNETRRLLEKFAAHNIAALPLKGAALMLANYYPLPGLRSAVDIDLLLPPEQAEQAFALALTDGFFAAYVPPGKAPLRVPHEMRHLPLLRNAQNQIALELHFRAFHNLRYNLDFAWNEIRPRAQTQQEILLPAPEDIALHLIQHAIVDLTSAHLILRTLADLHFLLRREAETRTKLLPRAQEIKMSGAVNLALEALQTIETGNWEQASEAVNVLLATALANTNIMTAARLFEYIDLRQQPRQKLRHLLALIKTTSTEAPKNEVATAPPAGNFMMRAVTLLRRFDWQGINFSALRRVAKLRKITQEK